MSVPPLLDDLDRALLARLGSDARTPVSALATTLGVARGTVQTRIARLLDGGVIRRFTVELDPTVDEQAVRAITLVQVSGATARAVAKAVRGIPEVRALHSTNGKWDMVAELHCGSLAELDQALAGLRGVRGVTNTETSILLARL
ncbi:Lrp/AsnC family transcriptional regulator [Phycicoccus elongatus]|uniref:Transcriptional regulator, AsnC family n=1 Tax=Phycicoccus elongatus Lp2 TaxID=1193181 RepID=N0DXN6_9MICO|nr:Lrp/AsnC family transcriptional regulator [Tetrasphaera sp.]CCH68878.1 Transcriptional regulator, AsnC family [Phycicoccus elongatus Lp2]